MGEDIGIDLGTSTTLAYIKGKGIVLKEPSCIAVDVKTGEVVAIGREAKSMLGKTNEEEIKVLYPLKNGVISNFTLTAKMLKIYINGICSNKLIAPRIMICVPSQVNNVEKRAVVDAALEAGAKKVYVMEEPIAAAIGAGIDIAKTEGNMIVDIGGGTTDIAIIAKKEAVIKKSFDVAGNSWDQEIIKYMKRRYNILIGSNTAERIKIQVGTLFPYSTEKKITEYGKSLTTGLPIKFEVKSTEIMRVMLPIAEKIANETLKILEKAPPELAENITENGIYMTGGGSLINGMETFMLKKLGINVNITKEASFSVVIGTGKFLESINDFTYMNWIKKG